MTDKVVLRRTSKAIIVKRLVQFLKSSCTIFWGAPSGRPIKVYQAIRTVLRREICNSIYEEGNSVSSRVVQKGYPYASTRLNNKV